MSDQNKLSAKETLTISLIVAAFTAILTATANYYVSTKGIKEELNNWRVQFEEQTKRQKNGTAHQKYSEVLLHHRNATFQMSYKNSALVEFHLYEAGIKLMKDPTDPVIDEMRRSQKIVNNAIADYDLKMHNSISEYEHRIKFLASWKNDDCADELLALGRYHHSKPIVYSEVFEQTALRFFRERKKPYQAIEFLQNVEFKDEISFEDEAEAFAEMAHLCFRDLM